MTVHDDSGFILTLSDEDPNHPDVQDQISADEDDDNFLIDPDFEFDLGSEKSSEDEHSISSAHDSQDVPDEDYGGGHGEQDSEDDDAEEAQKKAQFFAPHSDTNAQIQASSAKSFLHMHLARQIVMGLTAMGFDTPTPIQLQTIPVGLQGKDIVGGAVTGSGKTAAFLIPILDRLFYRQKKPPVTRVAILMPTRELAVQCFTVAKKIAKYTDITFAQIVGGFSLREQENTLKTKPDVVIATPGRFIDHIRNSAGFTVENIEILVLDEADRMLEDGFADELNEILTILPKSRQTMLFSATMTDSVDQLVRVGLYQPVRLIVDAKRSVVKGLVQEFLRLRGKFLNSRLAILLYLCKMVYKRRTLIFFRQKQEAHRALIIFKLCGLNAAELHGNIKQHQRIEAVELFRSGKVDFLLATDLASRGLDIKKVETVINYEAPQTHEIYLHRVGRTARAGRTGRSCTFVAEADRKVMKAAVKAAKKQGAKTASRSVPREEVEKWTEKLARVEDSVDAALKEEKEAKAKELAEREVNRGINLLEHEKEIKGRPKRTWFETEKDKKLAKDRGRVQLNGPEVLDKKRKKKPVRWNKLSGKQKKKLEAKAIFKQRELRKRPRRRPKHERVIPL